MTLGRCPLSIFCSHSTPPKLTDSYENPSISTYEKSGYVSPPQRPPHARSGNAPRDARLPPGTPQHHGIWRMVIGIWSMVYGIWYMVYIIWSMVYSLWYMEYDISGLLTRDLAKRLGMGGSQQVPLHTGTVLISPSVY